MCTLMMALSGVGTAMSAYGSYAQGKAQEASLLGQARSAEYTAAAERQNAEIARSRAEDEMDRGKTEDSRLRERGRQFLGSQRAALASNGVQLDSGSPLAMQEDTMNTVEEDAAAARYNTALTAWGFGVDATNAQTRANHADYEAASLKRAAKDAGRAGTLGAATSLIGGASSLAGQWDFYKSGGTVTQAAGVSRAQDWNDGGAYMRAKYGYKRTL